MINNNFSSIQKFKHKVGTPLNYKLARKTMKVEIIDVSLEFTHELTLTLVEAHSAISKQFNNLNGEVHKAHFDVRVIFGKISK